MEPEELLRPVRGTRLRPEVVPMAERRRPRGRACQHQTLQNPGDNFFNLIMLTDPKKLDCLPLQKCIKWSSFFETVAITFGWSN